MGWALYLPEEWCEDPERRRRAKIPAEVVFKTKPELGVELVERAAGWKISRAPILGDCAYGKNTELRERLDHADLEYVLSVSEEVSVFTPETNFQVPDQNPGRGRPKSRSRPDRKPEQIGALIAGLSPERFQTVTFRDGPDAKRTRSRFCFLRVRAANDWEKRTPFPPREEWLIIEWPAGRNKPTDYWLSNLPADIEPERLARLARMRWKIELDYKQLKGELGLDHYEGRAYLGWYHHTALVTAHTDSSPWSGRTQITRGRPDPTPGSPTISAPVQVLDRPLPNLPATHRPQPDPAPPNPTTRVTLNKALLSALAQKFGDVFGRRTRSLLAGQQAPVRCRYRSLLVVHNRCEVALLETLGSRAKQYSTSGDGTVGVAGYERPRRARSISCRRA